MKPLNIALLEDNPDIIEWLTTALELEGHTVFSFTHGPAFLKTLLSGSRVRDPLLYDLIICDLYLLGGRSSIDVIAYIQQSLSQDTLPIIIISGTSLAEIEYLKTKYPAIPVLRKPFTLKKLHQLIKRT